MLPFLETFPFFFSFSGILFWDLLVGVSLILQSIKLPLYAL